MIADVENRGAKTAMAVALQKPESIANIISVDNAPVDARLQGDFARYIQAMKKIDAAGVTRQAEADKILAEYEKVSHPLPPSQRAICWRRTRSKTSRTSTYRLHNNPVPPHPAIPPRQPVPPTSNSRKQHALQHAEIPCAAQHPRQGPRPHGRLPFQRPFDRPLRETSLVHPRHQEQVRARRGDPHHWAVLPAVRAGRCRCGTLAYLGEP